MTDTTKLPPLTVMYSPNQRRRFGGASVDMNRCRASVSPRQFGQPSQCGRTGVIEEQGYRWCRIHAPSAAQARLEASMARMHQQTTESASWQLGILRQAVADYINGTIDRAALARAAGMDPGDK